MFKENYKNYKILTPDGYKPFKGIQKIERESCEIIFECGKHFKCSLEHNLCVDLFKFIFIPAKDLKKGDQIFGHSKWYTVSKILPLGTIELYDIVGVEDTTCYYTDDILSHNCEFINSGTSSLSETLYNTLKKQTKEPVEILMDGKYQIFEHPSPERVYVAGVDVSEGVGGDFSVIKVLDITDLREIIEVAEYYDNTIPVAEFSNKLYEILGHWGYPLVCIERNNQGGQVADRLGLDYGYPRMVNWGSKLAGRKNLELFGMVSSRNTKYYACANARYFYNDKQAVILRNEKSLEELFKDFVKVNDTWQASSGKHDDRTMALIWALMILDKDLCERWFSIEEYDDCGKPLIITPLDQGIGFFENATSIYTNEQVARIEQSRLAPMAFGSGKSEGLGEFDQLKADGWTVVGGGGMPYHDPTRDISDDHWDVINRWFV